MDEAVIVPEPVLTRASLLLVLLLELSRIPQLGNEIFPEAVSSMACPVVFSAYTHPLPALVPPTARAATVTEFVPVIIPTKAVGLGSETTTSTQEAQLVLGPSFGGE